MLMAVKRLLSVRAGVQFNLFRPSQLLDNGCFAQCKISGMAATDYIAPVEDVSEICRLLSDYRSARHDLESALLPFSARISANLVEQVLKRCRNLGVAAHRFFLWAKNLPGFSHSIESNQIVVDILGSSKQFPLLWDFLLELRDGGTDIRPEMFWVIFRAYCKANLPQDAIAAFTKMNQFGLQLTTDHLNKLLSSLCDYSHVNDAQELFDRMKLQIDAGPKTYSILIKGWGDCGNPSQALKVFDEMRARGCPVDLVAYNTVLSSLTQGGMDDEAHELFQQMRSCGLEPNACTYSTFIMSSCRKNDVHTAITVLDRARRYKLVPNTFTYNSVIKLLCSNNGVDDAYKLLDEMKEGGAIPDTWSYNTILATHCKLREVNRALGLLRRMKKESCRPDRHTYNMLLKMLIEVGRVDRAMEVWDGMGEMGFFPAVTTYAVMVHGLCKKKGRLEDACRFFEMMVDEGIPPYECTCGLLKERLLRHGLQHMTFTLADKMRRSTSCSIQDLAHLMLHSSSHTKAVSSVR